MVKAVALPALAVVAGALAWPSPAAACNCSAFTAMLAWPKPDAHGVPTDTSLVVLTLTPRQLTHSLSDGVGPEIPLTTVRVLGASEGCGPGLLSAVFLRPETPLRPGTKYRLTLDFDPPQPALSTFHPDDAFITGPGPAGERAPPVVNRWVYANVFPPSRPILEVFAATDGPEPVFLVAAGKNPSSVIIPLGPLAARNPEGVSLGEVPCAEIELVDAFGKTLKAERLCQPERCHTPAGLACSSCGGNCGSGATWEEWQRRPTCSTPAGGCSTAPDAAAPPAIAALLVLLVLLLARRLRPRARLSR